ncbi:MAG: hypothetical protein Q4C73_09810 [Eubacteriales bacterium]|nr:hypothetical protein [Eubacteriales bacterium]
MRKKILVPVVAMAMLVSGVAGGSLAYLIDKEEPVTNTFTVGNVDITLAETKTDFKMVPGVEIAKDPVVTVEDGSEDCWLFVKIEESKNLDTFITYETAEGWTALAEEDGVYYRTVLAADTTKEFSVLKDDKVLTNGTVTKADMDAIEADPEKKPTLTFTAYAIQQAGFDNAAAAWAEINPQP